MKKIALLTPRSDWTADQFKTYWRETHGLVVSRSPGYAAFRQRYLQNHVVAPGPVGAPFRHGGVAEFWTPGGLEVEDALAKSDIYLQRIGPDEAKFLNLAETIAVAAEETVVVHGAAPVKVLIFGERATAVSSADYAKRRLDLAGELRARDPGLFSQVRGFSQNHVIEGSLRSIADLTRTRITFDSLDEYWFDDIADMEQFFATSYRNSIAPAHDTFTQSASLVSLVAEEIIFFDDGQALDPPKWSRMIASVKTR